MPRLFIGIKISNQPQIEAIMNRCKSSLSDEQIRWVEPQQMHLTLTFLGDVDAKYIPAIKEAIGVVTANSITTTIDFGALGIFKNMQHPQIIWLGINENAELRLIKQNLDNELNKLNLKFEDKTFRPHLTLGRVKKLNTTKALLALLDEYEDGTKISEEVNEIILFESILSSSGSTYKELYKSQSIK